MTYLYLDSLNVKGVVPDFYSNFPKLTIQQPNPICRVKACFFTFFHTTVCHFHKVRHHGCLQEARKCAAQSPFERFLHKDYKTHKTRETLATFHPTIKPFRTTTNTFVFSHSRTNSFLRSILRLYCREHAQKHLTLIKKQGFTDLMKQTETQNVHLSSYKIIRPVVTLYKI